MARKLISKTEKSVRDSIVRRACDHVSIRDVHEYDRKRYAEAVIADVRAMQLPNWMQVLRLAELVRSRYDATEASIQDLAIA